MGRKTEWGAVLVAGMIVVSAAVSAVAANRAEGANGVGGPGNGANNGVDGADTAGAPNANNGANGNAAGQNAPDLLLPPPPARGVPEYPGQPPAAVSGPQPKSSKAYPGPLGLKWGKSPSDARAILAGKVAFVNELPAQEGTYDTIDQHYSGTFAKMKAADVFLRFYRGEFFYMMVTLATADVQAASKAWMQAVNQMKKYYGKPTRLVTAPHLASGKAIDDNLPVGQEGAGVMPLLWNERTHQDELGTWRLRDLQIRTGLWDPFAAWRFVNGVTVQLFIDQELTKDKQSTTLKPVWIFSKDDLFAKWKAAVRVSEIVEPRDF